MSQRYNPLRGVLKTIVEDEEIWWQDAVCAQIDPEAFFPDDNGAYSARAAKAVCKTCPVISECAEFAIRNFEMYGIWGGLTPAERQKLRGLGRGRNTKYDGYRSPGLRSNAAEARER